MILNKSLILVGYAVSAESTTLVTDYTLLIMDRYWSFSSGSLVVLETRPRGACTS